MGTDGAAEGIPWQPPSAVEAALYEAALAEDWSAYFALLSGTDLFLPVSREIADATGGVRFIPFTDPRFKGPAMPVYTRGMLTAPTARRVHERTELALLARRWPRPARWLAVNPGTPLETFLPAAPRRWRKLARTAAPEPRLKTLWQGPRSGPLAHGMACDALMLVHNGLLWNQLGWQSSGYSEARKLLRRWWGVGSRREWQETAGRLLRCEILPPAWEYVLRVRQAMILESGRMPGAVQWRETAERVIVSRTAEVVDETGRPPGFDLDADLGLVQQLIGRVLRYEARFRADGLLAADECVRSVAAWDIGRASGVARWGVGAGFATPAEAETLLLRSGAAARQVHRSWSDFAAGYVLGRCLHFDSEEFGDWYTEMRDAHRLLSTEQDSPWLSVPWEQPAADRSER
ncbi:DUF1266 domain-containing protein [Streptomyces sp. RFCAC02]|uniref:DUF1266 domain-containing protein n=1 Tax=Streptomyces sp. RFCAC02 TaxID=2499143 RepID=UPI00101F9A88|nr:DUF1266 domain-containing protein [Streptomyces sp. RFCAC02]